MKKILLALMLVFVLSLPALAEETLPFSWFNFDTNTEVDAHYFLNKELSGKLGGGIAVEFAQLVDNIVGLRAELVIPDKPDDMDAPDKLGGIGANVKLHNAINKLGGKTIIPSNIQIGISALVDITHGIEYEDLRNPYISAVLVGIKF